MTITETNTATSTESLEERFRPIFADIAAEAVQRERDRELPFRAVDQLRSAGFGAVRVPVEYGGSGASLSELFSLLVELGEADSNLVQLLRGHFAFVEVRLAAPDRAAQREWLTLAASGVLFGNAQAERGPETGSSTVLTAEGDHWLLDGEKYYSTGTLFADWIWSTASRDGEHVGVALPADALGVSRLDDWDGFGQRMTGSGTTRFEKVRVEASQVIVFGDADRRAFSSITSFYQLVLLAALAGTGRGILRDATEFVRGRTRAFGVPGASSPRADPSVQQVVGKISSLVFASEALVGTVARSLDELHVRRDDERAEQDEFDAVEIQTFQAQQVIIPLILEAASQLFEVGGASATSQSRALDRHWRNARTIA